MTKITVRTGICAECGQEFIAGKRGAIARKCPECRKAREGCIACGVLLPRTIRANGSIAPAPLYCPGCKPLCAIPGCSRVRRKFDWCANHYVTWRTYGDPEREPSFTWAQKTSCLVCDLPGDSPDWEPNRRKFCSARCQVLYSSHGGRPPEFIPCGQCGAHISLLEPTAYRTRRRSDTRLCVACVRHARTYLTAAEIAERDGTDCRLCGLPVDMAIKSPNRWAPSVDHIIPRALGGSDAPENLQLAHRGCNSSKRHRYVG